MRNRIRGFLIALTCRRSGMEIRMSTECIKDANLEETGFSYTMTLIQGKYKMPILDQMCEWGEKNS